MKQFKLEKVALEKKDKIKIAICAALIFLCAIISAVFMIITIAKNDVMDVYTFSVAFICVYIGIFAIVCPCALIFSKIMKRARSKQTDKESAEVQDA